jgi:hypothetical protein
MNLLYEIKLYFDALIKYGIIEKKPEFNEIENVAEKCFHKNYKDLTKYIVKDLEKEKSDDLKSRIDKIKEIIRDDKKGK